MHFFVPEASRLVEITRGSHTSDATVERTLAFARAMKKAVQTSRSAGMTTK